MTSIFEQPELRAALRDPVDRTALADLTPEHARFAGGRTYPCIDGRPILIDETSSLFTTEGMRPRTHRHGYRDRKKLINVVRRQLLPGLTWNPEYAARVQALADAARGQPVLVIGCGDRVDEYRQRFAGSPVVSSDIHLQYGADVGIDAHRIPFADRTFGLVLADQVLEHTPRPWLIAAEMQRVARLDGIVHVEVPFNFPYHGAPYDFFRFTPSALRLMFAESSLSALGITEGRFSAAAVYVAAGLVDSFAGKTSRRAALLSSRLSLWWLKYLDARTADSAKFHSPKGVYVTVRVDGVARGDRELIAEVKRLVRQDLEE
jgi:hypothetical protein